MINGRAPEKSSDRKNLHPKPATDSISGFIERITYRNESNGFSVIRIRVNGDKECQTVVGSIDSIAEGESLEAKGHWITDKSFGKQFKADLIVTSPPSSLAAIEKFLASGAIKGIGEVSAKKLVATFGEKIFDIFENEPSRLLEVLSIGQKRLEQLIESWKSQRILKDIAIFLQSHGLSTSFGKKIFDRYGSKAMNRILENPYLLATQIQGIGFQTADKLAQSLGISVDSIERMKAAIHFTLQKAISNGHTAVIENELIESSAALIELTDHSPIQLALTDEIDAKHLLKIEHSDRTLIYKKHMRSLEERIGKEIRRLIGQVDSVGENRIKGGTSPFTDLCSQIDIVETKLGIDLEIKQKEALEMMLSERVCVVTGGPGTGKSTITKALTTIVANRTQSIALCAPTGRAAKRIREVTGREAKTIHRLLKFDPITNQFLHNESEPLETDLVICDEASMLDIELFSSLLRAIPDNAPLILIGDIDQLPSVGPGKCLSDLMESGICKVSRLTEVYRQAKTSDIIRVAHLFNHGVMPSITNGSTSDFFFLSTKSPEETQKLIIDLVTNRLPMKYGFDPVNDIQVLAPMLKGELGVHRLNEVLRTELNPISKTSKAFIQNFDREYYVGDKVMQVENNYDKEVFNGDFGIVKKIDKDDDYGVIEFDDLQLMYETKEFAELMHAYAISIHKSQGSEFPCVVIPMTMQQAIMLRKNLIYTAITRGKKLVVLVGDPRALSYALTQQDRDKRVTGLKEELGSS